MYGDDLMTIQWLFDDDLKMIWWWFDDDLMTIQWLFDDDLMMIWYLTQGMIHVPEATARELMNLAAAENDQDQVGSHFHLASHKMKSGFL